MTLQSADEAAMELKEALHTPQETPVIGLSEDFSNDDSPLQLSNDAEASVAINLLRTKITYEAFWIFMEHAHRLPGQTQCCYIVPLVEPDGSANHL